jgi:transcriptional regulator with XRE-family HTH domain
VRWIRLGRLERGLSQTELGRQTGMSQIVISLIETGQVTPTPQQLDALGEVLGLPPACLLREVVLKPETADSVSA